MAFELHVYIPQPDNNFEENLKIDLANHGLDITYPEGFSIEQQSGFMPLKIDVKKNEKLKSTHLYPEESLLGGFELDIYEFDALEYLTFLEDEGEEITEEYNKIVSACDFNLVFYINEEENTLEYRAGYLAAASVAERYNGVLLNPETGEEYLQDDSLTYAIDEINAYESFIDSKDWVLREFEGW